MKCHILFSGKNKNISTCRLLKILPRILSTWQGTGHFKCSTADKSSIIALDKRSTWINTFSYFFMKTYVMGTGL